MFAVRTIRLCTKDCLCLYVCPTGASDTENGQIDWSKCIGCGLCAKACPSHAISMVPEKYPAQQKKSEAVENTLNALIESTVKQEAVSGYIAYTSKDPILSQFATALKTSNRLMSEDLFREAGYMLPQSKNAHAFLRSLLDYPESDFPVAIVKTLLDKIEQNEN